MLRSLINLIYPNLCPGCNEPLLENEGVICLHCNTSLPYTNYYLDPENEIAKLFWGRIKLNFAFGSLYFVKNGKVQNLIHDLKYNNNKDIGIFLGKIIGNEINKSKRKVDVIIPVPLHPKKMKIRGYNQSEYLAEGILETVDKTELSADNLIRTSHSSSQTKKSKFERWINVGEIFKVQNPEKLVGKHVLIVDDVITTGSTIEACAQVLSQVDDIEISIVSVAVPVN